VSASAAAVRAAGGLMRGPATWYAWLLTGAYIYLINVQGNVVPFLQDEFDLSYRAVSLHSSAIAAGIILVGLFGERVARRIGRRRTLWLAVGGLAAGAILLCLSPGPVASIASCFLLGVVGTLIPAVIPALLADIHGDRRAEAYAGQSIVAYVFGLGAPLITGLSIWLGLGWRPAVVLGATFGLAIAFCFRRTAIDEPAPHASLESKGLPPAFWAYWALLVASCALEYCILMWAPAFLEQVIGFSPASAAMGAAGFPLGVLLGRIALSNLVRRVAQRSLLIGTLAIGFAGFLVYWSFSLPAIAVVGVFIVGLGIAPLYPLSVHFAVGAARQSRELASVRLSLAFGVSMLLAPIALGALADEVGLGLAHLALPGLIVIAYASFFIAEALEKRS
jgi:MFS transporter, DHA1 family, inner membrane transport protein